MKQIIAKQEYTDKFISLYEGQIRNIENDLADRLIEKGIVAEHSDGSGSSDDYPIVVHFEKVDGSWTADKKYSELRTAIENGIPVKGCVKYNNGYFDNYYYMDMYVDNPMSISGRALNNVYYNASSPSDATISSIIVLIMDNHIDVKSTDIRFDVDTSGSSTIDL